MEIAGHNLDVPWEFWRMAGKLRNDKFVNGSFHWRRARAMERSCEEVAAMVNSLWIDRLCEPWFDGSAFQ